MRRPSSRIGRSTGPTRSPSAGKSPQASNTRREGNSRIVECAIPWSEIPHVKARRDAGQPVKFTYRVNDNAGVGCLELAKQRSVSKQNNFAFLVRWTEHWANEVEFVFE